MKPRVGMPPVEARNGVTTVFPRAHGPPLPLSSRPSPTRQQRASRSPPWSLSYKLCFCDLLPAYRTRKRYGCHSHEYMC